MVPVLLLSAIPSVAYDVEVQKEESGIHFVPDYAFSGVFTWGEILTRLCEKGRCRLSLPGEFYSMQVPLSIYEKDFQGALTALRVQAKADGWDLNLSRKVLSASRSVRSDSSLAFLSCIDSSVVEVPRNRFEIAKKSDSLKCLGLSAYRADQLRIMEHVRDSLANGYDLKEWRLEYYSFSSDVLEDWGIAWSDVLSTGDFFAKPQIPLSWAIRAMGEQDSLTVFRAVEFVIDTTVDLTWGNTQSEVSKVYNDEGVITTQYDNVDYGMTINLKRNENRINLTYSFTQSDDTKQKISGASSSLVGDTLLIVGYYKSKNKMVSFVPFLWRIPLLGELFTDTYYKNDVKFFVLRLIPKRMYRYRFDDDLFKLEILKDSPNHQPPPPSTRSALQGSGGGRLFSII